MSQQSPQKVLDRIMNYPHKEKGCVYLCGPHLEPCVMVRGHDGDCKCRECHPLTAKCPECGHDEHGAVCPSPCLCMFQIKKIARAEWRKSTCENCGNALTISDPNRITDGEAMLCGRCV